MIDPSQKSAVDRLREPHRREVRRLAENLGYSIEPVPGGFKLSRGSYWLKVCDLYYVQAVDLIL